MVNSIKDEQEKEQKKQKTEVLKPKVLQTEVYIDNAATTKVDNEVVNAMLPFFREKYGNPSSLHSFGLEAQKAVNFARETIAKSINAKKEELFFTSGATESINMFLIGYARANKRCGNHIISTKIEHEAVLSTLEYLKEEGFEITLLDVDKEGFVDLNKLKNAIKKETIIVSIIQANNEVGTLQDIESIGKICKEKSSKDREILFHTDTTQSYTKVKIDVEKSNIGSCSISAHKFHGPKGVGAVYIKKGTKLKPYLLGGGQESGMRSGTQNVPGIVGMGKAAEIAFRDFEKNTNHQKELQNYLYKKVMQIPNTHLNGPDVKNFKLRLCNNLNFSFEFIEGEAMLLYLDMAGVKCSTGSACSSNSLRPSHVLAALGVPFERMHGTLRFSTSRYTSFSDCDYVYEKLVEVVNRLRAMSPLTGKKDAKLYRTK